MNNKAQALIDEINRAIFTDERYKERVINAIELLVEIAERLDGYDAADYHAAKDVKSRVDKYLEELK